MMKTENWSRALFAFCLLLSAPLALSAQKTAGDAARSREVPNEELSPIMKENAAHLQVLDRFLGSWSGEFKVMHGKPPKEATVTGTFEAHRAMDGKWIQSETLFPLPDGQKFENLSFFGYNGGDRQYKRFVLTVGDSREIYSIGTWDEPNATFTFTGTMANPYTRDSFDRRDSFKFLDADQILYKIDFVFADKTEIHVIEGVFKRKK